MSRLCSRLPLFLFLWLLYDPCTKFLLICFIVFEKLIKQNKKKSKKTKFGSIRLWIALVCRPSLCLSIGGGFRVDVVRFSTGVSVYRKVVFCFTSSSLWPSWNLRAGRPDCPAFLLASGFLLQKDLRNIRQTVRWLHHHHHLQNHHKSQS